MELTGQEMKSLRTAMTRISVLSRELLKGANNAQKSLPSVDDSGALYHINGIQNRAKEMIELVARVRDSAKLSDPHHHSKESVYSPTAS
jgi:hypothetical protein